MKSFGLAAALGLLMLAPRLDAGGPEFPDDQAPVHWAFATLLGTGWYKVDDSRSIFVLRVPPRVTLRKSAFGGEGGRRIGVDLKLPVTLGLHKIDDFPDIIEPDNFGTVSFTPGVDIEIPVTERFYLRPFGHIGWGTEIGRDYSAWIYQAGIKSRYTFDLQSSRLALIGNIYYAGYSPNVGEEDDLSGIALGVEGRLPLRDFSISGKPIAFDWHAMYTYFSNEPVFTRPDGDPIRIDQLIELGVAIGPRDQPWNFWVWKPERLGLGVQFDLDGNFTAITLNFTSWFRR